MPAKSTNQSAAQPSPSTEVATRPESQMILRSPDAVREFVAAEWLTDPDAMEMSIGIIDQVMSAETLEETLAPMAEAESWRDHIGEPFTLTGGMRFLRSDDQYITDKTIVPAFAVVQAVNAAGEQLILTTGGFKVTAQLWHGFHKGWWQSGDKTVRLVENETKAGYKALSLELAA